MSILLTPGMTAPTDEKPDRDRYPCLDMAELKDWALKFPHMREALEAEIAQRKIGRSKPRRYCLALDNYIQAAREFETIISKTDLNILSSRLRELDDSHEAELERKLVRREFTNERILQRYRKRKASQARR